jgi:hypothetical protein
MIEETVGLFMKVGTFGDKTASAGERVPTPAALVAEIL